MKILFAIKKLENIAGGAERVLATVSSELSERGHNIYLLTFDQPNCKPFYNLGSKVKLLCIKDNKKYKSNKLLLFISRLVKLRQKINSIQPDIAVGFMHSIYILLSLSLINKKINVIGSEHIVPQYYKNRKLEYFMIIFSTLFLKKITVLSEDIKNSFSPMISRKMIAIPNPIELNNFKFEKKYKKNQTILAIGRFSSQKDHKTLIEAFSLISDQFPNWNLKIVGDGVLRSELEVLIEKLNMSNKIYLYYATPKISDFYIDADLFVIPSKYESFGLVVAEAMGFGLPVIGFGSCPGINNLILHNKTGLLVDDNFDRARSLSEGMKKLMSDNIIREKYGRAGYENIKDYHSKKHIIDLWEDLLINNKVNFE